MTSPLLPIELCVVSLTLPLPSSLYVNLLLQLLTTDLFTRLPVHDTFSRHCHTSIVCVQIQGQILTSIHSRRYIL